MEIPEVRGRLEELFSGLTIPPSFPSGNGDGQVYSVSGDDRYRALIEHLPVGVYRVTPAPQSRLLMANQAFLDMLGLDREEALAQASAPDEFAADGLIPGEVSESELQLRRKDGTPLWCALTTRAVCQPTGEVVYFDCVIRDITESKRAEQSVWMADLWARRALDALHDAVLVITLDRSIVNANTAAEALFGYSHSELMCLSPEVLYVDQYAQVGRTIATLAVKGGEAHLTAEARRKNGQAFQAEHLLRVLRNDEGRPAAVLGIIREINRPGLLGTAQRRSGGTTLNLARACVYLGIADDPKTHHSYPCNSNYCHVQSPPASIEPPYQSSTCLTGNWSNCPYFKAALSRKK